MTLPKLTESICYEVQGEANLYLNLVSDTCMSVNAFYSAMPGGLTTVIRMSEIGIYAVTQGNGSCVEIKISADCSATLNGANVTMVQEVDGIHVRRMNKQWHVSVPNCNRPSAVMWITCVEDMLNFQVARGAGSLNSTSHGLLGKIDFLSMLCAYSIILSRAILEYSYKSYCCEWRRVQRVHSDVLPRAPQLSPDTSLQVQPDLGL